MLLDQNDLVIMSDKKLTEQVFLILNEIRKRLKKEHDESLNIFNGMDLNEIIKEIEKFY